MQLRPGRSQSPILYRLFLTRADPNEGTNFDNMEVRKYEEEDENREGGEDKWKMGSLCRIYLTINFHPEVNTRNLVS